MTAELKNLIIETITKQAVSEVREFVEDKMSEYLENSNEHKDLFYQVLTSVKNKL